MNKYARLIWLPLLVAVGLIYIAGPPPVAHAQIQTQIGLIGDTNIQTVTTAAVALAPMSTTVLCMKAVPSNTVTIYVGTRSNITAGTAGTSGFPLAASESTCWPIRDASLAYVISGSTGQGIAYFNTTQ